MIENASGRKRKATAKGAGHAATPQIKTSALSAAPRQPSTEDAWKRFAYELHESLGALEEDEFLNITIKGTSRYVQFAAQGAFGMRAEATSDFYLPEDEHLDEDDYRRLLELGWHAPTNLPDEFGHKADGSPNYFLDLAKPVPLDDVAITAVNTLIGVFGAEHPGDLEYTAFSKSGQSIRFPNLGIRRGAK